MITKILNKKNQRIQKNYQILIFSLNIDQKQEIRSMIFLENLIIKREKKISLQKK